VVFLPAADDADGDELDVGLDLELQAASITAGTRSSPAR